MSDMDDAKALLKKAINILSQKGTPNALQWLMDNSFGLSSDVQMDNSKSEKNFKDCQNVRRFTFRSNFYELIYEKGHSFYTPSGGAFMGDFRMMFNNELVLKTIYDKVSPKDEWSFSYYKILFNDSSLETLKMMQWVDDLPEMVELEKRLKEEKEQERKHKDEVKKANQIKKNIDLGDYK